MPNLVTSHNWTLMFELYVVRCGKEWVHKKHVFERDWTICSNYDDHSRFDNQHNLGGPL